MPQQFQRASDPLKSKGAPDKLTVASEADERVSQSPEVSTCIFARVLLAWKFKNSDHLLYLIVLSLMWVRVCDELPIQPRNLIIIDLLNVRLQVCRSSAADKRAPFLDDELFPSCLCFAYCAGHEAIIVTSNHGISNKVQRPSVQTLTHCNHVLKRRQ